jgi:hypothetical protein
LQVQKCGSYAQKALKGVFNFYLWEFPPIKMGIPGEFQNSFVLMSKTFPGYSTEFQFSSAGIRYELNCNGNTRWCGIEIEFGANSPRILVVIRDN